MSRKRFTAEQIISKLREVELAKGQTVVDVCRKIGMTEQTNYRWRKEYGGLRVDQVKRLKELEKKNARLKKLVADQALDNVILHVVGGVKDAGPRPGLLAHQLEEARAALRVHPDRRLVEQQHPGRCTTPQAKFRRRFIPPLNFLTGVLARSSRPTSSSTSTTRRRSPVPFRPYASPQKRRFSVAGSSSYRASS